LGQHRDLLKDSCLIDLWLEDLMVSLPLKSRNGDQTNLVKGEVVDLFSLSTGR
jgi:hypothetical protein